MSKKVKSKVVKTKEKYHLYSAPDGKQFIRPDECLYYSEKVLPRLDRIAYFKIERFNDEPHGSTVLAIERAKTAAHTFLLYAKAWVERKYGCCILFEEGSIQEFWKIIPIDRDTYVGATDGCKVFCSMFGNLEGFPRPEELPGPKEYK